jgi:hypothetical protein
MKRLLVGFLCAMITFVPCKTALAWQYANRYGSGSTYHAQGSDSTTRTNGYGGTATHTVGQGTSASSAYGGSAYHAEGSGTTTATGAYGGSAAHYAGVGTVGTTSSGTTAYASDHYYGGTTAVYHPPVVVNSYSTGCYNCGGCRGGSCGGRCWGRGWSCGRFGE